MRPWWFVLRQILVFSASLAVCLAGYGLAAAMIRHDPRLVGLLPLPAVVGFLGGLAVWLFGEHEADIGPLMVPSRRCAAVRFLPAMPPDCKTHAGTGRPGDVGRTS